jgi:ABC-type nitrate/sulfonate/bicarbonate transport system ATPase subunit
VASTPDPLIRVDDVVKSYPLVGGRRQVALSGISMAVRAGEFTCIVGPSGCGKSTMLFLLGGLLHPDRGSVRVGTSKVAFAFQEPRLLPWKTVRENVMFGLNSVSRSRAARRADQVLDLVGLGEVKGRFPNQLSGGMQQRVSIARALGPDPDVLLMDEPFSALDEMTARRLRIELLAIWERLRTTVVFVTHNALEASYLADRIIVMKRACIAQETRVPLERPRMYEDPKLFEVYRAVIGILGQDETPSGSP